ncbi:MAG TPA: c-type cytochrome domain-containing protein, partial [Verrucomicrobiae bacterium]|nr:c-type cytochrome domain-containing protein [Verrucomicrobiae bacterium]
MPSEEAFHDWSRSSSSPFALTALHAALILLTAFSLNFVSALGDEVPSNHPLPVASLNRTKPVDFESEILPFLKESCLACHNQTKAKADLILETPQTILKGGESGPAVVPENPRESLIFKAAGHLEKPLMPPKDNKVNAPDLNPEQLALLKLWIQQGAHGEVRGQQTIAWRPLGENVRPILALAVTADGQFAACGRGNELFVYQLPTGRTIGPISDPEIRRLASGETNAAHLDLIESLDFSPDGELLASGSYREVKLWRRQPLLPSPLHADFTITPALASATSGGQSLALASESGQIEILTNNTRHQTIQTNQRLKLLRISEDGSHLATLSDNGILEVWSCKDGKSIARTKLGVESQALAWAGEKLAAAGPEHTIQLWSLPENGTNLVAGSVLKGHKDSVTELESFNNGSELLSGST